MFGDAWQVGVDLHVPNAGNWTWTDLQRLASLLGTESIDLEGRNECGTLPYYDEIQGRYVYDGGGCESCGYGSTVIVRGILG